MSEDEKAQFVVEVEKEEGLQNFEKIKKGYLRMFISNSAEKQFQCKCSKKHESMKQLQMHILDDHTKVRDRKHCYKLAS